MSSLDDLIARARALEVRPEHARAYVDELGRWARRPAEPRRRWLPWLAGGFAIATTAAVVLVWLGGTASMVTSEPVASEPVAIGERVAIVPGHGAVYRLEALDRDHTSIVVDRGTVTARLFAGDQPHRLVLRGGDVAATATGTIYSLTVDDRGATVSVHEGKVEVRSRADVAIVPAGARWPADRQAVGDRAARALAMISSPRVTAPAVDDAGLVPPSVEDASVAFRDASAAPGRDRGDDAAATPDLRDRWRHARLLRAQGKPEAALSECLAIGDARDPTWSPIALAEAVRIAFGPLASPERAIELADRFERDWPAHVLAPDVRELRCRAARQLGRSCPTTP